jgi:aminotransferase EvaB
LDEVHAEILRFKLSKLDGYIDRRQKLAARYNAILAGTSLELPMIQDGNSHVYYVYVVRHSRRDELIAELKKKDILLNISYPWPIHLMRGYSYLGGKGRDLPITEAIATTIFSLPMYPSLTEEMQNQTCLALGELLGEKVNL